MNNQSENNTSIQMVAYVVDIINEYCTHSEKDKTHGREVFPEDRENIVRKKFNPREILLNVYLQSELL